MPEKNQQGTKGDIIFALLMGIIVIFFLIGSLDLSSRAGLLPLSLSLLGLPLVVIQIIKSCLNLKKSKKIKGFSINWSLVYIILLVLIYPAVISIAGYLLGSYLEALFGLYVLKYPYKKWNPLIALVITLFIYFIFKYLMYIRLPAGIFGF